MFVEPLSPTAQLRQHVADVGRYLQSLRDVFGSRRKKSYRLTSNDLDALRAYLRGAEEHIRIARQLLEEIEPVEMEE